MKVILLHMALLILLPSAFCQNNVPSKTTTSIFSEQERWNLDKYVWSHTHYKTSAKDKPVIDFDAIDNWIGVGENADVSISPDGQYFAYGVQHTRNSKRDSMVVQSTENNWRRSFAGANPGFFSGDSKHYIFQKGKTLYFVTPEEGKIDSLKEVESYKTSTDKDWVAISLNDIGVTVVLKNLRTKTENRFPAVKNYGFDKSGQWLYYEVSEENPTTQKWLGVFNLNTGKKKSFLFVDSYLFDEKGQALVIKKTAPSIINNKKETSLAHINLRDSSISTIWSSTNSTIKINSYSMDRPGEQVVINLLQNGQNSIWYWKVGMDSAVLKINTQTEGIDKDLLIQGSASFTDNGKYIRFNLQRPVETLQQMPDAVQLDVWSFNDTILQSAQPELLKKPFVYNAIFNLEKHKIVFEERDNKKIRILDNDFAIIAKSAESVLGDRFWDKGYYDSCWVLSLKDGYTKLLPAKSQFALWTKGNYIVYFDSETANYFSYNVLTRKLVNMTAAAKPRQLEWKILYKRSKQKLSANSRILGWLDENGFMAYDNYDIWQLDLEGKTPPINITNGYGHTHQIIFQASGYEGGALPVFSRGDTLLLKALNRQNKSNGFYRKIVGKAGDPEKLYMGPYFFEGGIRGIEQSVGLSPLKAAQTNVWILQRQTAVDAPNYFVTSDLKEYKRLTDFQPQKAYNWLTAELHSFKQLDGTITQGILYKPENFNPKNKYPVVVTFYTQLTDELHRYFTPTYIKCPSIFEEFPWMVSHGYLVFMPDIYFTKNEYGPSTVNTIDGAARYLKTLPFVDGKRLGVGGHSNSGRFGYYLLTHSRLFAAMSLGSGHGGTDILSVALSNDDELKWGEEEAYGTGLGNIWQNKQRWVDHIALLQADRVSSPLLLFHNKGDGDDIKYPVFGKGDDVMLANQFFMALRRQNKPIWWLQYDEGGHRVFKLKDERDFTIRYTQFFDHYLKGSLTPRWMKDGIPYKFKGIESRYQLEER